MKLGKALTRMAGIMMSVCMLAALTVPAAATADIASDSKYEPLDESKWELVWYDEFNGATVDTGKWEFTIGGGGFGNNEQQYYTDSADNAFIRDGSLVLKAIQGEYGGEDYTSAKLSSTESWKYGRFEFSSQAPGRRRPVAGYLDAAGGHGRIRRRVAYLRRDRHHGVYGKRHRYRARHAALR